MLNHCVFTVLHVHPCGCSFFVSLCLEGPTVSHLEGSLCLPPVYSANKNSCLSCTTASHACFLPFLQTDNNNESAATGREKKTTFGTTQDSYTSARIPGNNEAPRVRGEEDEEESASSFLLLFPAFGFKVSLALMY